MKGRDAGMKPNFLSELEEELKASSEGSQATAPVKTKIGVMIEDPINRRLVEGASLHLELTPVILSEEMLDRETMLSLEVVVADVEIALRVHEVLAEKAESGDGFVPAVIGVTKATSAVDKDAKAEGRPELDGSLVLPMAPGLVSAQLSLIVYAHRAFARRYQSALEELQLNRRIFRSVTSGITVSNTEQKDFPLVYVNPAFEVMTGYSFEEAQGENCRFLQGEEHDQPGLTLIREALREEREVTAVLRNYRKDGTPFWNELSLSPIRNREGRLTHFVGIQTDVTARVEFEMALRESEKLAAVGRLASSIAHEINNPLESLMNLIYLAQHTDPTSGQEDYLRQADRELQRVKLITSQSLRFYKQSTKPQAIGCTELLVSVLDLYQTRLENSMVKVERRERSTQSIVCMESEIRQVLNNLVSNAIDAMHGTGGTLYVRSREATEWRGAAKGVLITIADNGGGMSPETMKDMYKAFFTTKGIKGTGLGLWISSEIVERHRGRLRVRSRQAGERSGTVFELFLPYQGVTPAAEKEGELRNG